MTDSSREPETSVLSDILHELDNTDPPPITRTKGDVIYEHAEIIRRALERGWTQNAIVNWIRSQTGITITTETLRNNLPFSPKDTKPTRRKSLQRKARSATRRRKRHEAKTKTTAAASDKAADGASDDAADDTASGVVNASHNGDAGSDAPAKAADRDTRTDPAETAEPAGPTGPDHQNGDATAETTDDTTQPAPKPAKPGHAALQEDF